ncbi:MAG TPA: (Fe-S)-binding protein [Myxococcota bacterium]|nr:(Fe-S)-binding protein [Myxococcota bacterium]HRY96417.1 (Fe-S)-binding protein [Myxococcota bacterium]HSA21770.1 (Fe-S)-binding protein [Myxococcota bacterium]
MSQARSSPAGLGPHVRALKHCTYCPKLCRFCCPTAEAERSETVTPWFKMTLAELTRLGRRAPAGGPAEVFQHCLGCLHCRTHCRHQNDVPGALLAARAVALEAGAAPPATTALLERFRARGNPWGEDLAAARSAAVPAELLVPEAQAVLFPGCQALRAPARHLTPLLGLLAALGVEHVGVFSGPEVCCGAPLWQAGDLQGLRAHGRALAQRLAPARTILCPCPTCAWVLGVVLREAGCAPSGQVVTLDAFLAPFLRAREPARQVPGRWVFHDPCYLTRYLERGETTRQALQGALREPLLESAWSGQDAACCGGGGLVPHSLPGVARQAAALRAAQLEASGAEGVVTACPGCVRQLGEAGPLPVKDWVELLAEAYAP